MCSIQEPWSQPLNTLLFLCDFHGRDLDVIIGKDVQCLFLTVLKPDAPLSLLTDDVEDRIRYFSKRDLVVIFGGSNDVDMSCDIRDFQRSFEMVLEKTVRSNLIVALLPLRYDKPDLNVKIKEINDIIEFHVNRFAHSIVIDFHNLPGYFYAEDGFQLNARGKGLVGKRITEVVNKLMGYEISKKSISSKIHEKTASKIDLNFEFSRLLPESGNTETDNECSCCEEIQFIEFDKIPLGNTDWDARTITVLIDRATKAEKLKELEMKLKEKEELEEKVKKEIEGLEDDMMCSICAELYIEPTALNCGHMFCKLCITEWSKKKKICPMCRAKILTTVRIFNMDSVIQRNIRLMSEEAQSRREALIAERKKGSTPQKKRSAKKRRREVPNFREPSPEPIAAYRLRTGRESPRLMHRIRPFVPSSSVEAPHESEGDPFEMGWVRNQHIRSVVVTGRNSPVTIAAVDLTNVPMTDMLPGGRARTHTVTSADANTTIDLTDL